MFINALDEHEAMLKLKDFMTRDVAVLTPDDTLRDAVALFSERFITGAPVVAGDDVVGVVSAMDVMDFAASADRQNNGSDGEWALDEVPSEVTSSYFTDLWEEGVELMDESAATAHDLLAEHTVSEIMTHHVLLLSPDTEVHDAAAFMIEHGVHRVLVAADGQLEGLVSTTDFLRLIAERRL
ncbi:MAG TPA: CBS domain-containing protein [Longimicrobiales bacterium]|nr:CBS domain-containing protein [Longimicrobiales bacterium]